MDTPSDTQAGPPAATPEAPALLDAMCRALPDDIATPCTIVSEAALRANLDVLADVQKRGNCRILLALKAFSMFSVFDSVRRRLAGVCASGVNEALLGHEFFHGDGRDGEVHAGAPAFSDADMTVLAGICDHIVFNSFSQFDRHLPTVKAAGRRISLGLRLNPGYSEVETEIYNPCGRHSRLGLTREAFRDYPNLPDEIDGLHFHSLCEQGFSTLEHTWRHLESRFGELLARAAQRGQLAWLNLGGGHHITAPGYDIDGLCALTREIAATYGVKRVYLEPGEAIAINTGVLAATVLDVMDNGMPIAILDASAAAHMPDVLEMPYRPEVFGAGKPGDKPWTCRLAGPTCLAGDVIGDYSFDRPLTPGDRVILMDMSHYTMVKNNTFNGMALPSIMLVKENETRPTLIKKFGYEDFKGRLS